MLKGRKATLFLDLGGYVKWSDKATEVRQSVKYEIKVSTILEDLATKVQRSEGLDITDYILEELKAKTVIIQSRFSEKLKLITEEKSCFITID